MKPDVSRTTWISVPAGISFRSASTATSTASTTSTVFALVCLVMSIATAGFPLISASDRCSSTPSTIVATSPSVIGCPPRRLITICR